MPKKPEKNTNKPLKKTAIKTKKSRKETTRDEKKVNKKVLESNSKMSYIQNDNQIWIVEIWNFLKNPKKLYQQKNKKNNLKVTTISLLKITAWAIIIGNLANLLTSLVFWLSDFSRDEGFILMDFLEELSVFELILMTAILVPLVEEMFYRFFMSKIRWEILIGSFFLIYNSLNTIFVFVDFSDRLISYLQLGVLLLSAFLIGLYHYYLPGDKLKLNFTKNFNYWMWGSSAIFGLIHLANFENLGYLYILTPVIVLPQFLVGLIFAFVRVRFSLTASWIVHGLYNFLNLWLLIALNGASDGLVEYIEGQLSFQSLSRFDQGYLILFLFIWFIIIFKVIQVAILELLELKALKSTKKS